MVLHIVDISNALYAGMFSDFWVSRGVHEIDGQWKARRGFVGPIRFTLRILREMMGPNSIVIPVMERTPTIKRKMYYDLTGDEFGYKAGRKEKPEHFDAVKDYLEVVLRDLGFPVQYVEGYEADDIIYTLVELYKYDFEKIYVHTRDSDLFFLVSDNVEIAPVGSQGKVVDMYNYSVVIKKGWTFYYNTVHIHKLLNGDSSDNISGIGQEWGKRIDSVIPEEEFPRLGNLDLTREYLRELVMKYPTEYGVHKIIPTFNLLVPLKVPTEYLDMDDTEVDMEKLDGYYLQNFNAANDRWNLEELLDDYINNYYS